MWIAADIEGQRRQSGEGKEEKYLKLGMQHQVDRWQIVMVGQRQWSGEGHDQAMVRQIRHSGLTICEP